MSVERRGPAICNASNIGEGKDEMTKASIELQDLRRRLYVKVPTRQRAEAIRGQNPSPPEPVYAIGSLEWQRQQEQARETDDDVTSRASSPEFAPPGE